MLETPSIRRYSFIVTPFGDDVTVSSDNPSGAVNQQERPGAEEWAVGFVDGEGCFSISVVRNTTCRGCGRVVENPRWDNHRESLRRFSVKRRAGLVTQIVPFFEVRPLRTAKQLDFEKFADVMRMMQAGEHLTESGLRRIARITEQMNRRQRSRFLESSEAIRQPPRTTAR
jgi:hypothetical protein